MHEVTAEYLASQGLNENFPKRFWPKVHKTDSCWIWIAGKDPKGYGKIHKGTKINKQISAHLASWILNRGPVPNGLCVLHNCPTGDNPACVNPDHLWLGSKKDNTNDAVKKGTWKTDHPNHVKGETHPNHVLTEKDIIEIMRLKALGFMDERKIAMMFSVSFQHINDIVHRKCWKHIP